MQTEKPKPREFEEKYQEFKGECHKTNDNDVNRKRFVASVLAAAAAGAAADNVPQVRTV